MDVLSLTDLLTFMLKKGIPELKSVYLSWDNARCYCNDVLAVVANEIEKKKNIHQSVMDFPNSRCGKELADAHFSL